MATPKTTTVSTIPLPQPVPMDTAMPQLPSQPPQLQSTPAPDVTARTRVTRQWTVVHRRHPQWLSLAEDTAITTMLSNGACN
eukprot:2293571-Amphidinium_carterae.3